jgi:hypothetical protein
MLPRRAFRREGARYPRFVAMPGTIGVIRRAGFRKFEEEQGTHAAVVVWTCARVEMPRRTAAGEEPVRRGTTWNAVFWNAVFC